MVANVIEESALVDLKNRMDLWEGDALLLIQEIKEEVDNARKAMDADPPQLYILSNSLVDLSMLNIRLIDRIVNAKYFFNEAKGLYESQREGWKVKLVQGYTETTYTIDPDYVPPKNGETASDKIVHNRVVEGVAAGVADSMKVGKVREEYEVMNQAEKNYETVNLTRRAIEKAMEGIRSKLSYEKNHET